MGRNYELGAARRLIRRQIILVFSPFYIPNIALESDGGSVLEWES